MAKQNKAKVGHYPFEKENQKDLRVCKMCGKIPEGGIYGLVGGICIACHSKANIRKKEETANFDATGLIGVDKNAK